MGYAFSAALLPAVIFVYFGARNLHELEVWFIAAIVAVIFLAGLVGWGMSNLFFRDPFMSMVFSDVIWLEVYFMPVLEPVLKKVLSLIEYVFFRGEVYGRLIFITSVFVLAAFGVAFISRYIKEPLVVTRLITGVTVLLLIFNGISIGVSALSGRMGEIVEIKNDFTVNMTLESPNIYWIQPDGMLGFDAVEKYYGDSQDDFYEQLENRGFDVAREASFEACHTTQVAIPSLISPNAYDHYIGTHVSTHEDATEWIQKNTPAIRKQMLEFRRKGELQTAFATKGYVVDTIGPYWYYYPPKGGYIYPKEPDYNGAVKYTNKLDMIFSVQRMIGDVGEINEFFEIICNKINTWIGNPIEHGELLPYTADIPENEYVRIVLAGAKAKPSVPSHEHGNVVALYDVIYGQAESPRLVIVHDTVAHNPYELNADGSIHDVPENPRDPLAYHDQHIYSGKVLIGMIDMIIRDDPDAVIVIQADHGLHGTSAEAFHKAFGKDADEIELWNSTMSAVRIPEKYRNGEEVYMMESPLNISRYIVNRFVGENYDYIN